VVVPDVGMPFGSTGLGVRAMIVAANLAAADVDPAVFSNRFEGGVLTGTPPLVAPPPFAPWGQLQLEWLSTFTYRSFRDATQFFTEVSCPRT
jgi:hypothetical protein